MRLTEQKDIDEEGVFTKASEFLFDEDGETPDSSIERIATELD